MDDMELLECAARAGRKPVLNPIGETYGRLTVIAEIDRVNPRKRQFRCACECGCILDANLNKLRSGHTRSCGCLHKETILKNLEKRQPPKPKHGMNKTPEHGAWVQMKQRCNNPKRREYPHYGGRGIKVCDEWMHSFTPFYEYVGRRPSDEHSLDRYPDTNGNYEPGNVRWATQQEQIENTTVVRMVTIEGKTQSISAWEREMGLSKGQVRAREANGWVLQEAILAPSVKGQKRHMNVERDYSTRTRDSHGRYRSETA